MKILLVNKFFYRKGGADAYFLDLGKMLEQAGHEVAYFSMHHPKNNESRWQKYFVKEVDYTVRDWPLGEFVKAGKFIYSFEAKIKIRKLLTDFKPDLVHLNNIYHQLSTSILYELKKYPAPKIMTLHDFKLICPNYKLFTQGEICERCYKHKYYQAILHKCLQDSVASSVLAAVEMYWAKAGQIYENVVDCFVSPSAFLAKKIKDWQVNVKRFEIMPNFVNLNDFLPEYTAGEYYLYFGRLDQEKGLADLVNTFKGLPGLALKIAGTGPMEASLKEMVKAQSINNIEFVGFKEKNQLRQLIKNCRAVLVPSIMHDVYPYSVLEAQAMGKAVIASKRGGIPEMVEHEKNGYLYEPETQNDLKSRIEQAEREVDNLSEFGKRARQRVEKENDSEKYLQKITQLYQQLK